MTRYCALPTQIEKKGHRWLAQSQDISSFSSSAHHPPTHSVTSDVSTFDCRRAPTTSGLCQPRGCKPTLADMGPLIDITGLPLETRTSLAATATAAAEQPHWCTRPPHRPHYGGKCTSVRLILRACERYILKVHASDQCRKQWAFWWCHDFKQVSLCFKCLMVWN